MTEAMKPERLENLRRWAGLAFVAVCDEIWIPLGTPISAGMRDELDDAKRWQIPIVEVVL